MARKKIDLTGISEEAAFWVVRLHDGRAPSPDLLTEFAAWRSRSPTHEVAYERELAAWMSLARLRALKPNAFEPDNDLLAAPECPQSVSRRWAAAAAVLALAGGVGFTGTFLSSPAYATGVGERRRLLLDDGTRVELNTNSRIVVRYEQRQREVELTRGEALFNIADDKRPFVLITKTAKLRATSSALNVRLRPTGTTVLVKEGTATIQPIHALAPEKSLKSGTEADVTGSSTTVASVSPEDISRLLAWRNDAIDLHGQTLREAIDEFNRYNRVKLEVVGEPIANLRLGGYFSTHDVDQFVQALCTTFNIRAVKREDGVTVLVER